MTYIQYDCDKFGNDINNLWKCPKCGAEFLQYVMQWDCHLCLDDECGWVEGIWIALDSGSDIEIPYRRTGGPDNKRPKDFECDCDIHKDRLKIS